MTDQNKNNLVEGAKILALVLWAGMTIMTCAGVWNFCLEPFIKWVAGGLMLTNGFAIYKTAKKWFKANKE